MTEAEEILTMIENVSTEMIGMRTANNDINARLNEIDTRVRLYVHQISGFKTIAGLAPQYTCSRDALKRIRPEGWDWLIDFHYGTPFVRMGKKFPKDHANAEVLTPALASEELAELHAIIQALEYERTSK